MKSLFEGFIFLFIMQGASQASDARQDPRFIASLKRLDAETRLDQICDYEAMLRLGRDPHRLHRDRAKAEVLSKPVRTRTSVTTTGGAFRSAGRWYVLSYACETTSDQMTVTSFSYQIGKIIPITEWPKYGLWR